MIEGTNNYSHDYVSYSFTQDAKYGEFADKHSSINESIWIKEDKNHNKIEEYSAAEKKDSGNLLFEYFDKDENGKLAKMAEDTTGDGIPEIVQVFDVNK